MRVLLATDGSPAAGTAVDLMASVTWPPGTRIEVVASVETELPSFGGPWPAIAAGQIAEVQAAHRVEAKRSVDEACARLAAPDLEVGSAVLLGRPATTIVEAARKVAADLIVVGSRGHGTIERMLLGSVSAEVIDHATTPVLVARGTALQRVVLAWDGSSGAARAAELLARWPIFGRCEIRVVSVAEGPIPWWAGFSVAGTPELVPMYGEAAHASRTRHEALARSQATDLQSAGMNAGAELREGDAATELVAAANAWHADLIVMGTHGRTGLARLVMGSVARNLLHHAPCSVLVVREPG